MSYARHVHTCNLITRQSGEREIVIVGGIDPNRDNNCNVQKEVEIIDVDTKVIRNGKFQGFNLVLFK